MIKTLTEIKDILSPTTVDTIITTFLIKHGYQKNNQGIYEYDPISDWTQDEIDSFINFDILEKWRNSNNPSRQTLIEMLTEAYDNDPYTNIFQAELYDKQQISTDLTHTLAQHIPEHIEYDYDLLEDDIFENILDEITARYPDIENLINKHSDVLADIILNDDEEWNSDFTNINVLAWAHADPSEVTPENLQHVLKNNGLSLFAERIGLPRDCMIVQHTYDDTTDAETASYIRDELESTNCYGSPIMCIFARIPFSEYVETISVLNEKGRLIMIEPYQQLLAGLYDPWNGAGGSLDLTVPHRLAFHSEEIADVALETMHSNKFVSRYHGYPMSCVYGTDESPWRSGHIRVIPQLTND